MMLRAKINGFRQFVLILLFTAGFVASNFAENSNSVTDSAVKSSDASTVLDTQQFLRSYLQIQEQLHTTQMAIEKNRQDADAAAARNAEALETRLARMEKALQTQRLDQLKDLQHQDNLILITAGGFAVFGLLVLLSALYLQYSAVNRLSAAAAQFSSSGIGMSEAQQLTGQTWEQSTARFLRLLEQMEGRMRRMEISAGAQGHLLNGADENGDEIDDVASGKQIPLSLSDVGSTVSLLLNKGQALLKLDQAEAALSCMEEVLVLDPANTDALVKKGAALERLQRLDEAVKCYDTAIEKDNSMTMAYLYKGGVFNRMERYSEALECYEQALKTRQNGQAANVIMD